jgi:hypothetical protein
LKAHQCPQWVGKEVAVIALDHWQESDGKRDLIGLIDEALDSLAAAMRELSPACPSSAGATDAEERLAFELTGTPEAGWAARRALLARNGALPRAVRDDVLLLMTELVTNAVRHGDAGPGRLVRVELRQRRGAVRVAVCDEAPVSPGRPDARGRTRPAAGAWCSSIGSPIAGRLRARRAAAGWFEIRDEA